MPASPASTAPADDLWRVFESTNDGITICRLDGSVVVANPAMCAMHGYTHEEFLALPSGAHIHPDFRAPRTVLLAGIKEGTPYRLRARDIRKDGSGFDVDVLGTPMMYNGELHVLAVIRDITEQVRAEQLLEQRVAQRTNELATLLDAARNIASTLDLDSLLNSIIEQLARVLDYSAVAINVFDGEHSTVLARRGPGAVQPGTRMPGRRSRLFTEHLARGAPVIIADVRGISPEAAAYRELVGGLLDEGFEHVSSYMAAGLNGRRGAFGALTVSWHEPDHYSEDDGRLLMAFADLAAIGLENARLFDHSQQRTKELEALLTVSRETTSSLELNVVLDRIIELLKHVVDYSATAVSLFVGGTSVVVARRGPTYSGGNPNMSSLQQPVFEARYRAGQTVIIDDVRGEGELAAAYRDIAGDLLFTRFAHVRSYMGAPLRGRGGTIGSLTVAWHEPGRYTEDDGRLLIAFADHVAVAVENARLFEETVQRAREIDALYTADAALHRSLQLSDVLQAMADVAVDVAGAEVSGILLRDPETQLLRMVAMRNLPPEALEVAQREVQKIAPERDARARPVFIADVESAPFVLHNLTRAANVRAVAQIPLKVKDQVIGYFHLGYREPREFTEEERRLYMALTARAALAVENAQLYERAQVMASLEERQRLARELHDSVSQALYGIALGTSTARKWLDRDASKVREPLEYAMSLAEVGLAEMRALIFELRPESLESEGLTGALKRQVAAISARYEIEIVMEAGEEPELSTAAREALYRIAQEAIHNVVKHAHASRIDVRVETAGVATTLVVSDDGAGFDPEGDFPGHLGLKSMRERAERAGGVFEIASGPGTGTTISVHLGARG